MPPPVVDISGKARYNPEHQVVKEKAGTVTNRKGQAVTNEPSHAEPIHTVVARVIRQEGHCGAGHQVGDQVTFDGQTVQGRVCLDALAAFMPWVLAMRYGARFPWEEDQDVVRCACPDPANPVVFELRRVRL
jgi:uncharacterized repeat protein (TIGR04076 family)